MTGSPRPFRFGPSARLTHRREFARVREGRARVDLGPLSVFAIPNPLDRSRLGMSIGRRLGGAVRRNRLKRLLRESFRLERSAFPAAYDVLVTARPHAELPLDGYRAILVEAIRRLHETWTRRNARGSA
jgi:ribonuclease P protein component